MSLGTMLDAGIGMIFVFLLLGLIVSALQEVVASLLALRGKYLLEGISTILADGKAEYWLARAHILPWSSTKPDKGSDLFKAVSEHALIRDITPADVPSYVPAANFAVALIDSLRKGGVGPVANEVEAAIAALPDGPARQALNAIFVDAKGDAEAFQKKVEAWFDTAMDRVSGVYKRWTQYFALVAGIVIAVALNANSILIADALWTDPLVREAAVKAAEAYAQQCAENPTCPGNEKPAAETGSDATPTPEPSPAPPPAQEEAPPPVPGEAAAPNANEAAEAGAKTPSGSVEETVKKADDVVKDVVKQVQEIGLPIGWEKWPPDQTFNWPLAILGWLITGFAVSLGAPFWFGLLKTFLNIRGAGPNPAEQKGQK
jgi:hypothetical protein